MNSKLLTISMPVLNLTVDSLRAAGAKGSEGVVLWLARNVGDAAAVCEAYVPDYVSANDFFHIPPPAMSKLLGHLGRTETMIAAQVHSHPKEAFHSPADDRWAIVRHEGALSLVVPRFAKDTDAANFMGQIAAFRLDAQNEWIEIPRVNFGSFMVLG